MEFFRLNQNAQTLELKIAEAFTNIDCTYRVDSPKNSRFPIANAGSA